MALNVASYDVEEAPVQRPLRLAHHDARAFAGRISEW
jgi:hypothetical protein